VRAKQEEYLKANKREKTVVAKDIVKLIRLLSPPGRFLKKDAKNESVYGGCMRCWLMRAIQFDVRSSPSSCGLVVSALVSRRWRYTSP
jgi:hypothetical protein